MKVVYKYFAIKPLKAEHPIGSGQIVLYQPGDEIPAGEWGRAADNLVEMQKAARVAFNVPDEGDLEISVGNATVELEDDPSPPKRSAGRPKKTS